MKKRSRKSMFRDFKTRDESKLGNSYAKYHRLVVRDIVNSQGIKESHLNFMLFVYNYEFFTLDHMSEAYFYVKLKLGARIVFPLMKMGYIYKYYDKLTPNNYEEAMFDESKMRYRVRYALSQKGRILVQRYYRKLEGEEQISVPSLP